MVKGEFAGIISFQRENTSTNEHPETHHMTLSSHRPPAATKRTTATTYAFICIDERLEVEEKAHTPRQTQRSPFVCSGRRAAVTRGRSLWAFVVV